MSEKRCSTPQEQGGSARAQKGEAGGRLFTPHMAQNTGYPGGLKERTAEQMFQRDPTRILEAAVYGMLPKDSHRKNRASRLKVPSTRAAVGSASSRVLLTNTPTLFAITNSATRAPSTRT